MRWDLFCNVVDNFGDIGLSWRLARQLAAEYRAVVRLWVDDLATFKRLAPALDPGADGQSLGGIEVRRWITPFPAVEPGDVVVETFGCELPASYVEAMAARARPPVWINLEFLSAEPWVAGCHGLPSPHPRLPLTKFFFFPGFVPGTGGVPIERGLAERRLAFQSDADGVARYLASLDVPPRVQGERLVSLFCYPQAPVAALLDAWAAGGRPVRALAFAGTATADVFAARGLSGGGRGGALAAQVLPFLSQDDYDRVLWSCDWNFVRGEDSFVRAQLAARPLVWQAYPQAGDAHRLKVEAFLARYLGHAGPGIGANPTKLWAVWNSFAPAKGLAAAWAACTGPECLELAQRWQQRLPEPGGLAGNLAKFCAERL
ncbi:MAG TPA: elongation factor P maturation arginine rhamnosyltransferase EarP [Burkholderiales bacterium]|nr:elongation factor P maturation arginine rhamnosyltransferase EarP [Burkholderiales bacterium]